MPVLLHDLLWVPPEEGIHHDILGLEVYRVWMKLRVRACGLVIRISLIRIIVVIAISIIITIITNNDRGSASPFLEVPPKGPGLRAGDAATQVQHLANQTDTKPRKR